MSDDLYESCNRCDHWCISAAVDPPPISSVHHCGILLVLWHHIPNSFSTGEQRSRDLVGRSQSTASLSRLFAFTSLPRHLGMHAAAQHSNLVSDAATVRCCSGTPAAWCCGIYGCCIGWIRGCCIGWIHGRCIGWAVGHSQTIRPGLMVKQSKVV